MKSRTTSTSSLWGRSGLCKFTKEFFCKASRSVGMVMAGMALSTATMSAAVPASDSSAKTAEEGVDLGLSVIWSTQYLEASSSDAYSNEYVWASPFSRASYMDYAGFMPNDMDLGLSVSSTNCDAASMVWGDGWRLPTKAEVEELLALGMQDYIVDNRVSGYTFTGTNGASVVYKLVKSGYLTLEFWTSTAYRASDTDTDYTKAWMYEFSLTGAKLQPADRNTPCLIIPVKDKPDATAKPVSSIALNSDKLEFSVGDEAALYAFVQPEDASCRLVNYVTSDESVATVDRYYRVKAVGDGTAKITASATDGSGIAAVCEVTVGKVADNDGVDLGLSVIWAPANVGAASTKDMGDFFMFATPQIVTKWSTTASPYVNNNPRVVPVEDVTGTQYDAATVFMGNGWFTPSKEQVQELFDNCTMSSVDGGFEFTSKKNGEKLFFPATGYMNVSARNDKSSAYFQTSKTNDTDLVSGNYPAAYLMSGMLPGFENRKNTQGVVVRGVRSKSSGVEGIAVDDSSFDVYNLKGMKLLQKADRSQLMALPSDIYILRYASGKTVKVIL